MRLGQSALLADLYNCYLLLITNQYDTLPLRLFKKIAANVLYQSESESFETRMKTIERQKMDKKVILVVDDAPAVIDLLSGLLKEKYKVKAALNGRKALQIAQSEKPPHLILLDIVMPEMDGLEVCTEMKENDKTANIPVVFLSGEADDEACERGMEIGGAAYLKKPVEPESLFSIIEILLS